MGDTYIFDGRLLMILGGFLSLVVGMLVWVARASLKRLDRGFEKIDAKLDKFGRKSDAQLDKFGRKIDAKADPTSARLEAKIDAKFDKLDQKGEERHREVQATLLDLTYKVGRLAGAGDVKDGSADQSRKPSLRRNNDPSPTPRGAPGPARVPERYDRSMVPLAGVRPEPAVPAGLARQAVPGQKQTSQQDTETGPEPHAEDAPDTAA